MNKKEEIKSEKRINVAGTLHKNPLITGRQSESSLSFEADNITMSQVQTMLGKLSELGWR